MAPQRRPPLPQGPLFSVRCCWLVSSTTLRKTCLRPERHPAPPGAQRTPTRYGSGARTCTPDTCLVLRTCAQSKEHHRTLQCMLLGRPRGGGQEGREQGPARPSSDPAHVTPCGLQAPPAPPPGPQHVCLPTLTSLPPGLFTNSRHHRERVPASSQVLFRTRVFPGVERDGRGQGEAAPAGPASGRDREAALIGFGSISKQRRNGHVINTGLACAV